MPSSGGRRNVADFKEAREALIGRQHLLGDGVQRLGLDAFLVAA